MYVAQADMLLQEEVGVGFLIRIADVTELPEVPEIFVRGFWEAVGRVYEGFRETTGKVLDESGQHEDAGVGVEKRDCPRYERLWEMALEQRMVIVLVENICRYSTKYDDTIEGVVDIVMEYLERRIDLDWVVLDLLFYLRKRGENYYKDALRFGEKDMKWTTRGMRLISTVLCMEMLE